MPRLLALLESCEDALAGPSPAAERLRAQVERIAGTPGTTVLLTGTPGQPFGAVARAVHVRSAPAGPLASAQAPCAAPALDRWLEEARGGTLFLSEVGRLDLDAQDGLLAHLERTASGRTQGGRPPRLLASTTEDLEGRAAAGTFRPDLFYRLNVLTLRLPSLDERQGDLPVLADAVLRRLGGRLSGEWSLTPGALGALAAHGWSADLFELETVLARAALTRPPGPLRAADLPLTHGGADPTLLEPAPAAARTLRAAEEALIRRVLDEETGNRSRTARTLGINRTTLYNKLRQYGIE